MDAHLSKTRPDTGRSRPSVTDCHFHVFDAHAGVEGARYRPAYAATWPEWKALAAACGVERGVLVQTSFMGSDNAALLGLLAQHPDSLRGVAVMEPGVTAEQLQALHAGGVRGLRLNLVGRSHDIAEWSGGSALWERLEPLGWHVELHTDTGRLPEVLPQLPVGVPVVVDHFARPGAASLHDSTVQALLRRSRRSAVHVKLSAAYRLNGVSAGALARLWLRELGAERLLWGSDWPCTNHEPQADYPALVGALDAWLEDDAAVVAARATNPARLYWGEPTRGG